MEWIDAATAAERLGVKPATLYAYVSRGVLQRRHGDDGRRSLFSAEEIERLARRGRPRSQPPELVIESGITALGVDRPYYRGLDVLGLARVAGFETVAEWLWTGDPALWPDPRHSIGPRPSAEDTRDPGDTRVTELDPHPSEDARTVRPCTRPPAGDVATPVLGDDAAGGGSRRVAVWRCEPGALRAAMTAQRGLPGDLLPLDRLQVITTVLGASDSLRYQLNPASVAATGRRLIAGLVDALPQLSEPQGESIAERLWSRLSPLSLIYLRR
ncbi:helix-turn-helix domain-containing protein, partial [Nonomuraea zeae]